MLTQSTSSLMDQPPQYKLRASARQRNMRTSTSSAKSNSSSDSDYSTSSTSNTVTKRGPKSSKNSNIRKSKKQTPPEKRRVRTGCLTCRSKHKKCDEVKPVCNFCQTKGLECIWPQEGMSRPAQLNDTLKQLLSLKKEVISADGTEKLLSPVGNNSVSLSITNLAPKFLNLPPNFPAILSMIPALQKGDFTSNINSFIFFNDKSVTSSNSLFSQSLTNLLSNYFLTDPTHILHLSNPNHILSLSRESKSLTFAILAISSRILEQLDRSYSGENTLDFYLLSVRELSKYLRSEVQSIISEEPVVNKECIWWTVIMLCWFEAFTVDPNQLWGRIKTVSQFCETLKVLDDPKHSHVFCNLVLIPYCYHMYTPDDAQGDGSSPEKGTTGHTATIAQNELSDSNSQMILNKLTSTFRKDILNITLQSFATKNNSKLWVDVWNSLLEWRMKLTGNEDYVQENGSIILAVDRDLHNFILYHATCYFLLSHRPENVSLVFQTPNDFTSIIAFAMYQDTNDYDETMNWHRSRLMKIMQCNMTTKSKKSTYASTACWFGCYALNDDKYDNNDVRDLLKSVMTWCSLDAFKWLGKVYN